MMLIGNQFAPTVTYDVSNRFFGVMGSLLRRARWRNGVPRVNFLAVDAAFVAMRLTCMYDVAAMHAKRSSRDAAAATKESDGN